MKVVYSNLIPFKGFLAINLFGVIFVRKDIAYQFDRSAAARNHELIHTAQMKELWYVPFYLIYFFEWIYRLIFHTKTAYSGLSFEIEARKHEFDFNYLRHREHFAQWKKK